MRDITEGMVPCVVLPLNNRFEGLSYVFGSAISGGDQSYFYSAQLPLVFSRYKDFDIGWHNPETSETILCGEFKNGQRSFGIDGQNREDYFDKFVISYLSYHDKDPESFMPWNDLEALYKNQFREPAMASAVSGPSPNP